MTEPLRITGTFLDEVTADIAGHNWGVKEWTQEFDTYVEAGIDTVILISSARVGVLGSRIPRRLSRLK